MMNHFLIFFIAAITFQLNILNAQTLSFTEVAQALGIQFIDDPKRSACWGDYDNDNDLDLYVISIGYSISGPQQLNSLFRNDVNINGTFTDVAVQLGVDEAESNSWGAAWCDVNNDGHLDLYVCNISDWLVPVENKLFINNGNFFDDLTNTYNVSNYGNNNACSWGDYDNDGDQDLFVAVEEKPGQQSKLFRNDGCFFTDVTSIYNITGSQNINDANWVDFDNDGDLDLYMNISHFRNKFYENRLDENNTFEDISEVYALNDSGSGASSIWFDYDNDGDQDLFLLKLHSKLYRNDINTINRFTDVTSLMGFPEDMTISSATFGDYDLDGDLDIYMCDRYRPNKFYRNEISTTNIFIEQGILLNIADTLAGGGVLNGDYDNDGDLDIYVLNGDNESSKMYRNEINLDNYLTIRLTDKNGSYNRYGSKVMVYHAGTDSLMGMREVDGGGSGGSTQDQYDCHFGLNPNLAYDIEVIFTTRTNGQNHIFNKHNRPELGNYIPSQNGRFLEVRDSVVTVTSIIPVKDPKIIKSFKLYQNYPNPFNNTTIIPFQIEKKYHVKLTIHDINGKEVINLVNKTFDKGFYKINWNGKNKNRNDSSSGVYLCIFYLDNKLEDVIKLFLIR